MAWLRTAAVLPLMLASLALAAACKGGGEDTAGGTEAVRERDGVRMTLSLDRDTYGPEDPVIVSLKIENTTDRPVQYGASGRQGLLITVAGNLTKPQVLPTGVPEDDGGVLDAGRKIERRVEWDKMVAVTRTPVLAPPGKYTVGARFLMVRAGFAEPIELAAAVTLEVEGTPYVQPPLEALRAALANDQVKAWAQGHGDTVLCAYAPRDLFYNGSFSTGLAAESFDFLYKQQLESGEPVCGIATEGEAWRLVFFSSLGEEPHRLTVDVALDAPEVLQVQEGGPTPAPTPTPSPSP